MLHYLASLWGKKKKAKHAHTNTQTTLKPVFGDLGLMSLISNIRRNTFRDVSELIDSG